MGRHEDVWELKHLPREERLRKLGFSTLEKRRLWGEQPASTYKKVIEKTEPDSPLWHMVGGQEALVPTIYKEKLFPHKDSQAAERCCTGSVCPWRFSGSSWIKP